jgi:hypothetical protein
MTGLAVEAAAPFFRDPTKTAAQVCTPIPGSAGGRGVSVGEWGT